MGKPGYNDGKTFVERLERAQAEGDADAVSRNVDRLRQLIATLQDKSQELADLQYRARSILEQHEPSAAERIGDPKLGQIVERIEDIMRDRQSDPPAA